MALADQTVLPDEASNLGILMQRVVLFDFDGTVADTFGHMLAAYREIAHEMRLPVLSEADVQRLRAMTPRQALQEFAVPLWRVPVIGAALRTGLRERMHLTQPFPGIGATIRSLRQSGYHCGIVSSNTRESIRHFLQRNDIGEFELVSAGTSVFGKASKLRKLIRRTNLDPGSDQVFYVGDEVRDVQAAAEARVRSIAVTWGYCDRSVLVAQCPDFVVDTPEQLLAVLGGRA